MGGTGPHTFSPKSNYTREQGIASILKFYDWILAAMEDIPQQDIPLGVVNVPLETLFQGQYAAEVIEHINIQRANAGLADLSPGPDALYSAALVRARELEVLFSHDRPDGREWFTVFEEFDLTGICAENAAFAYSTPEKAVKGWMGSIAHRVHILNPAYTKVGIGIHRGMSGKLYWIMLLTR
jgi:uncharacterized protein YkwD